MGLLFDTFYSTLQRRLHVPKALCLSLPNSPSCLPGPVPEVESHVHMGNTCSTRENTLVRGGVKSTVVESQVHMGNTSILIFTALNTKAKALVEADGVRLCSQLRSVEPQRF